MDCHKCDLSISRTHVVLGVGNKQADIMIIGEAPGYQEDKVGTPFVGESGEYLKELLANIGITEENAYITNVVKCRPPKNRTPFPAEISICTKYFLSNEIQYVDPVFIIAVGKTAIMSVTGKDLPVKDMVGGIYAIGKRWVIPIYHPSYILQNPDIKSIYGKYFTVIRERINYIESHYVFEIASNFNNKLKAPF
jgi:uracil-DNA glycosylase